MNDPELSATGAVAPEKTEAAPQDLASQEVGEVVMDAVVESDVQPDTAPNNRPDDTFSDLFEGDPETRVTDEVKAHEMANTEVPFREMAANLQKSALSDDEKSKLTERVLNNGVELAEKAGAEYEVQQKIYEKELDSALGRLLNFTGNKTILSEELYQSGGLREDFADRLKDAVYAALGVSEPERFIDRAPTPFDLTRSGRRQGLRIATYARGYSSQDDIILVETWPRLPLGNRLVGEDAFSPRDPSLAVYRRSEHLIQNATSKSNEIDMINDGGDVRLAASARLKNKG